MPDPIKPLGPNLHAGLDAPGDDSAGPVRAPGDRLDDLGREMARRYGHQAHSLIDAFFASLRREIRQVRARPHAGEDGGAEPHPGPAEGRSASHEAHAARHGRPPARVSRELSKATLFANFYNRFAESVRRLQAVVVGLQPGPLERPRPTLGPSTVAGQIASPADEIRRRRAEQPDAERLPPGRGSSTP